MSLLEAIPLGSRWIYVGPGEGVGEVHRATSVSHLEITTWQECNEDDEDDERERFSWLGGPRDFFKQFTQAEEVEA